MSFAISNLRPLPRPTARVLPALAQRAASNWASVPVGPPDAILGLTEAFVKDPNPNKVNLGVGAFRDDDGKPVVLNCVRKAEQMIVDQKLNKEYAPIAGQKDFTDAAAALALGADSAVLKEKRYATTQTISGTGALRIAMDFLSRFHQFPGGEKNIYMPNPTWKNHESVAKDSGLTVKQYRYFKPETCGLDFDGMVKDIETLPKGSVLLLHACAHNPTGVDATPAQQQELAALVKEKQHFPLFDMAYQGFASGDVDGDAKMVRTFVKEGMEIMLCQSFAKNMGLYGERVGALTFVTESPKEAEAVLSQAKIIVRPMYSSPPINGARLATFVLNTPELKAEWLQEVKGMADRILLSRQSLKDCLKKHGSQKDWSHLLNTIGMFCYTGLSRDQCIRLRDEYSVYMTLDGRMSVAGVNSRNVDYLAKAIHDVTK